ncbi:hypothetical protein VMCG_01593 [Cytospora schulzeri]|uniref:WH1 domain-containing protein n=1 Tax=Cytospora schulzeri TaxID=448051 RepID=A0A423X3N1_9PEZI|nr:hypothetical protein VMCG_01593 [Valsa malicola]
MPSILSDADKETVKRFVPKQTNKIQAVAVARLYVAYPNPSKWTYSGLQGAVVLANDLVGNTYWLKMVDISPAVRGVIWDQEIFDTWSYNQDRTFFHTFEIEDCVAGLSFVDEKEAKQFKKKMDDREKNASKATKATPFGGTAPGAGGGHHKHSLLGGIFGGHRHSSAPTPPPESPRTRASSIGTFNNSNRQSSGSLNGHRSEFTILEAFDPEWREHFGDDLKQKGLTDDFIKENQDFIVDFLKQEQAQTKHSTPPPPPPPVNGAGTRAPPPPPAARRGGPPPPPAPRRSGKVEPPTVSRGSTPPRESSPPRPKFSVPPALANAGKLAHDEPARSPAPGPPPPPRPAKTPVDESGGHKTKKRSTTACKPWSCSPSTPGTRNERAAFWSAATVASQNAFRGRSSSTSSVLATTSKSAPKRAPQSAAKCASKSTVQKRWASPITSIQRSTSTPSAGCRGSTTTAFASDKCATTTSIAIIDRPARTSSTTSIFKRATTTSASPASRTPERNSPAASTTTGPSSATKPRLRILIRRAAVLGDIQKAGGIGALRKVDRSQIRDRSSAQVGGGSDTGPHGSGLPPAGVAPAGGGGMADALAAALAARNKKVSHSAEDNGYVWRLELFCGSGVHY